MYTLHLDNGTSVELSGDGIMADDAMLPGTIDAYSRHNPNNVRLWVIGNEYGPIVAVWAPEQDALDVAVDAGRLDSLMIDESDAADDTAWLGNASEPFNLDNVWMHAVAFDPARDILLITAIVRAHAAGDDTI